MPGHGMRRLQQIAVAIFMQEAGEAGVTPVQYAVLHTLGERPGVDQRTLAESVSLDTSTIGNVLDRLEARGWVTRSLSPHDRRVRLLNLTGEGQAQLSDAMPRMLKAQERILEPLTGEERQQFLGLMRRVVDHHVATAGVDAHG